GVQLAGLAVADEGALTIETLGAIDIDLLGVGSAATNIVLDLISDPSATPAADAIAPTLLDAPPDGAARAWPSDEGIELLFDEPIDIAHARDGGIRLRDAGGALVPIEIESDGALVVV